MPTYAELQAESWWNQEVRTPELKWLGDEMCRRTKRPRAAAGDKGDRFHLNGSHRSQEWILRSRWCTNRTYTVQAGLTAEQLLHIAGFDFTPGSDAAMIAQCKRLMAALKAGKLDEVREFYGNVDGDRVVDGWDNLRDRAATSDSSHLWHWHLSIDRRKLTDRKLMERIVSIALGDERDEEDDMPTAAEIAKATVDEWDRRHGRIPKLTGDAKTQSVGGAQSWTHKHVVDTRNAVLGKLVPGQAAILAALNGASNTEIMAKLDQLAAEELQRDEQARAELVQRVGEIAELVGQAQSGTLDAAEVVRRIGEKLTASAPSDEG